MFGKYGKPSSVFVINHGFFFQWIFQCNQQIYGTPINLKWHLIHISIYTQMVFYVYLPFFHLLKKIFVFVILFIASVLLNWKPKYCNWIQYDTRKSKMRFISIEFCIEWRIRFYICCAAKQTNYLFFKIFLLFSELNWWRILSSK